MKGYPIFQVVGGRVESVVGAKGTYQTFQSCVFLLSCCGMVVSGMHVWCGVEPNVDPEEHSERCWMSSRLAASQVLVGCRAGSWLAIADFRQSLRFRQDFFGAGP